MTYIYLYELPPLVLPAVAEDVIISFFSTKKKEKIYGYLYELPPLVLPAVAEDVIISFFSKKKRKNIQIPL
jgi:hypothetical protein